MPEAIIIAFIGGLIALVSYWVQAQLARNAEAAKFERDNKREVYNQFLTALVGAGTSTRWTSENAKFSREILDAKARIILYGSYEVVRYLAKFWENPVLDNEESYERLTSLVSEMRSDLGAVVGENFGNHVKIVLFERYAKAEASRII